MTSYRIKLLSETVYDLWSASAGNYAVGDLVRYELFDYRCLIDHVSDDSNSPANPTYWICVALDAGVLGYDYDDDTGLLGAVPWFQVDDIVEVVELADYDEDGAEVAGSERWRICETAVRVEDHVDDQMSCSLSWNAATMRAMAVFV